jgi:hypothetical protein
MQRDKFITSTKSDTLTFNAQRLFKLMNAWKVCSVKKIVRLCMTNLNILNHNTPKIIIPAQIILWTMQMLRSSNMS